MSTYCNTSGSPNSSTFIAFIRAMPPPAPSVTILAEGGNACDGPAEDEGVDLVCALVGSHALQVAHVAHGRIVEGDAVAAEDGAGLARYLYGLPDVVELAEAYVLGPERASVLHPAYVEREERPLADLDEHVRQLLLHELEAGYGLAELLPLLGVRERGLEAVPRRPHRAPDDSVPGLAQAGERPAQAAGLGQHRALGEADVFEMDVALDRSPHRELGGYVLRREAFRICGYEEAANGVVPFVRACPDYGYLGYGGEPDPTLLPVQDPVGSLLT